MIGESGYLISVKNKFSTNYILLREWEHDLFVSYWWKWFITLLKIGVCSNYFHTWNKRSSFFPVQLYRAEHLHKPLIISIYGHLYNLEIWNSINNYWFKFKINLSWFRLYMYFRIKVNRLYFSFKIGSYPSSKLTLPLIHSWYFTSDS